MRKRYLNVLEKKMGVELARRISELPRIVGSGRIATDGNYGSSGRPDSLWSYFGGGHGLSELFSPAFITTLSYFPLPTLITLHETRGIPGPPIGSSVKRESRGRQHLCTETCVTKDPEAHSTIAVKSDEVMCFMKRQRRAGRRRRSCSSSRRRSLRVR